MSSKQRNTITLEAPWWRCENGNEFRSGQNKPQRCPVCGSTKIEMIPEVDSAFLPQVKGGNK
jgi:rubrerythrin